MTNNRYPETVNFYPVMAIHAARRSSRIGGGYRFYVLAKALDKQGRGAVSRDALRAYAEYLGVSTRQYNRWMTEARNTGLFFDVQRESGEWEVVLPSAGAAMYAMGGDSVGNRRAEIKPEHLIGKGWKARIWAAYEVTHNGKPVSRERMQKIVNVPVSTQRYRDAQAGVERVQNHAKLNDKPPALGKKADYLSMLREYSKHKGLYIRRDGHVGSRKPDSRYSNIASRGGRGRSKKANKTLHRMKLQNGLSLMRQALSSAVTPETAENQSVYIRLFNYTPAQVKATERKLTDSKGNVWRDFDIFQYSHDSRNGAKVWIQC
ncbi:MAG: hypothetical protein JETCAE01_34490 [Anaerolineaceae bacterium]|nr:MAG: hypothetical protein JETCAE01_34490 [Anaerolineaceae bacterium]